MHVLTPRIAWLQERREEVSNPDGLSYPEDEELDNSAFEASQLLFRDLATDIGVDFSLELAMKGHGMAVLNGLPHGLASEILLFRSLG